MAIAEPKPRRTVDVVAEGSVAGRGDGEIRTSAGTPRPIR